MISVPIKTDTIRLAQALKLANAVQDGVEAKYRINCGEVMVNGDIETRRGRKLRHGDRVEYNNEIFEIVATDNG